MPAVAPGRLIPFQRNIKAPDWRPMPSEDNEPALVTAGRRIVVSVLEVLQLSSVAVPEVGGARLDVDVVHMSGAIGEAGNGVEKRGTDDVTDLQTGVVFAVAEGGQLDEGLVSPGCGAELLREDGVGDVDVLELVAAVGDAEAGSVALGQVVLEVPADPLYR